MSREFWIGVMNGLLMVIPFWIVVLYLIFK